MFPFNSEEDDIGPVISSDGKLQYFARQNVKENIGGIYDDEDIYISQWQRDAWTRVVNMGRSVNTRLRSNQTDCPQCYGRKQYVKSQGRIQDH